MSYGWSKEDVRTLSPKQPEFVLVTTNYSKKCIMKYNLSHFYQFTAESDHMGVIPDACIDMLFWEKNGVVKAKAAGTLLEKGTTKTELNCRYFGVRFLPGVNPVTGNVKLSELVNNEISLEDIITGTGEREVLLERMHEAQSFHKKTEVFLDFYLNHFLNHTEDRNSLKYVIHDQILNSDGSLKLSELSRYTGYSERYLNQKIHEDFGMNPKNLIRFIRFQKSVSRLVETIHCANGADTASVSGYYDQSHFIKEFVKMSGFTPSAYVETLLGNAYDKKLHVIN
ncbi:AraC family transcriptional regulator [Clostridium boliviensis]|uniref:AraC family transcriptional regulator n=1 Tax=Clostridium boliviensis TaxID=318465 RepID=A0ABU4GJT5_9CLOT|nr:AraC family transcriptional regulator [Clostridium boliviensis]MDW2797869.1 AraC family transcriptional regulator [Clostridium boliviensis]